MSLVVFVSGHLNLTAAEFEKHYIPALDAAIEGGCCFVVGDCRGADTMAFNHLSSRGAHVVVYHMFTSPRVPAKHRVGGFRSDDERDKAMTRDSHKDIAWVRPEDETRALLGKKYRPGRISGTERNLRRRGYQW